MQQSFVIYRVLTIFKIIFTGLKTLILYIHFLYCRTLTVRW